MKFPRVTQRDILMSLLLVTLEVHAMTTNSAIVSLKRLAMRAVYDAEVHEVSNNLEGRIRLAFQ
jgi:hypothetical protein